jgi:NDP-sugar pyrophosphorylase family protein
MEKINLIIPMNGLGNRFREEDYQMPKPLINVLGKPMLFWLLDNLNLSKLNSITIPYTSLLDAFSFQNQLKQRYPQINFNFLPLSAQTKGAAETVLIALNNLNLHELDYSVMVMDCDTFYFEDVISLYLEKNQTNQIFCFDDLQTEPIYSYIKVVGDNVTDIAEKNKISKNYFNKL